MIINIFCLLCSYYRQTIFCTRPIKFYCISNVYKSPNRTNKRQTVFSSEPVKFYFIVYQTTCTNSLTELRGRGGGGKRQLTAHIFMLCVFLTPENSQRRPSQSAILWLTGTYERLLWTTDIGLIGFWRATGIVYCEIDSTQEKRYYDYNLLHNLQKPRPHPHPHQKKERVRRGEERKN